ncbi:MAG: O-antigen ligase family protein [Clostridiales bacterium]|nr:O-antigen ligase family protein [Clostridiales bacterium]
MDHSYFFKAFDAIFSFIGRLFSESAAVKLITTPVDENKLKASISVRVILWFFSLLERWRRVCSIAYENSLFCFLMENLGVLARGSVIAKLFCKAMGIDYEPPKKSSWHALILLIPAAIAIIAAFALFPPLYAFMGVITVTGAAAAFSFPEAGVVAVAASAPFLPTMVLAAMLGYIAICFLVKLLIDFRYSPVIDITGLLVIFYSAISLFYGFTSLAPASSLKIALLSVLLMLSYLVAVTLINAKQKLDLCIFTFCSSAAATGVYGLYQKLSGKVDTTWVDKSLFSDVSLRIYSTFDNPNVYGTYLLLAIPICLVMAFAASKWFAKIYYFAISALLIYNLGYTYSRGCYLALGFGVLVFILFMNKRLVTLFFAGLPVILFMLPTSMINRMASILNMGQGDSSTTYRISIWQATLRILKDFWISGLGQGIEAYNVVYPRYGFSNVTAPHSHSLYLQIFAETGIFGFLVFIALILSFFKIQVPFFTKTRKLKSKMMSAAFMSAVAAFLVQGIFDYVFYNYRVMLIFFLFLGLANALVNIRLKGDFC